MKEIPFELEVSCGKIRGYLQMPKAEFETVVVFLHGWIGYDAGPHRILYQAAEELAQRGIATVRFDFFGRGESDGEFHDASFRRAVEDTRNIAQYARKLYGNKEVAMIGICYGAAVGFKCCDLWDRMVLWSPEISNNRSSVATRLRTIGLRSGKIVKRFISPNVWYNVWSGRTTLSRAYKYYTNSGKRPYCIELPTERPTKKNSGLLVFAESDPMRPEAQKQYESRFSSLGIPYKTLLIEGADHSYCSVIKKKEVIAQTVKWLCAGEL